MVRPEIYFDTHVIRDAADGVIAESDWKRTTEHVARKFRHRISPVTLYELLTDIASGDESEFERRRERIRRLFLAKKNRFLRLPRYFAAEHLFGDTRAIANMEPDDFDVWSRVVLAAADKNTLLTGVSMKDDPRMRYRLDLGDIEKHLNEGRPEKSDGGSESGSASPDSILRLLWQEPDDARREKVAMGLSAALALEPATNKSGTWMRMLQLFYLCDPEIIFVTSDAGILAAAKNSTQAERVWDYDTLKRQTGA
jgi:hypothetical protein